MYEVQGLELQVLILNFFPDILHDNWQSTNRYFIREVLIDFPLTNYICYLKTFRMCLLSLFTFRLYTNIYI